MSTASSFSHLILASASPRRRELLARAGIDARIVVPKIDESILPGEAPAAASIRLARTKAVNVGDQHPDSFVLAADTIVALPAGGESFLFLGKPENREDALRMLSLLSGRAHLVVTGFVLFRHDTKLLVERSMESLVIMKKASSEEIAAYANTKEPYDKAGAYAIQGIGASFVSRIEGSVSNVMGLPLVETLDILKEHGLWRPQQLTGGIVG